jgi:cobalt/nickel transport system permease protein
MHISEGVLSAPVLITGATVCIAGVGIGLKKMDYDKLPRVAVLASTFFLASLIHVPMGPSSVHMVLNGVNGLLLGWAAFPAIMIAVALQAILFQFGGLTTLGVNTCNMAVPAILCYYSFRKGVKSDKYGIMAASAFSCGFVSVLLSSMMVAITLAATGEPFFEAGQVAVIAHIPVMVTEGLLTIGCTSFLRKVKPEVLDTPYAQS